MLPHHVLVHTCVTLHHAWDDSNVRPGSISHTAHTTRDYMCPLRTEHLANSSIPSTRGGGASQPGGGCWRVPQPAPELVEAAELKGSTNHASHAVPSQQGRGPGSRALARDSGVRGGPGDGAEASSQLHMPSTLLAHCPSTLTISVFLKTETGKR